MLLKQTTKHLQTMQNIKFVLLFFLLPFLSFCQEKPFEVFGEIAGDYNSKVYLFFEGNYRQRDSISCEINNGKFYFKGKVTLPIQARLHMDQQSFICDIYIDNSRTYVKCMTKMEITNKGQDTLNMLSVVSVKGSATDKLKSDFEAWLLNLKKSKANNGEKREAYYQKLATFIKKHPKNKVSIYLLGKASILSYSQVKELSTLIDTSINKTFEAKSIKSLLNQLDKSKNYAVGVVFQHFLLRDSSGHEIDTKQFKGKYTLIVCWASWCKPCRVEHPDLNVLYKKYKDKGFEIVGVSLDKDKQKWTQAIAKDQLLWPQLIDPNAFDGEMAKHYGIDAIPASYLLDKDGKIVGKGLTAEEIEATIKNILD
jgi:thiol-disulfide isomerase/thioredoxin